MSSTYGRKVLDTTGRPMDVTADGHPEYKPRGATIDWSKVTPVSVETRLPDDTIVPAGARYLRYGHVMTQIGTAEVQTFIFDGAPSGGSVVFTLPAGDNPEEVEETTVPIPYNATAAEFQAAVQGLHRIGPNNATVTRTGAGSIGDPYTYVVTLNRALGNMPELYQMNTFTGGTNPTVNGDTTTGGVGDGKYGPYDNAATDGRQTLARGQVFILSRTVLESELGSEHAPFLEGGLLWRARVIATVGTPSLAAGPTFAALEAAMPRVRWVDAT